MNSMRNLFIVGVSLFLGLSIPEYFREYTIRTLHGPAHTKAGWVSFLFINQSYLYKVTFLYMLYTSRI
jgi:nucleobase transporter 1/2